MVRKNYDGAARTISRPWQTGVDTQSGHDGPLGAGLHELPANWITPHSPWIRPLTRPNVPRPSEVHCRDHEKRHREAQARGSGRRSRKSGRARAAYSARHPGAPAGKAALAGSGQASNASQAVELESETLEAALGYQFASRELLARAFTHRSSVYEKPSSGAAAITSNWSFWATRSLDSW